MKAKATYKPDIFKKLCRCKGENAECPATTFREDDAYDINFDDGRDSLTTTVLQYDFCDGGRACQEPIHPTEIQGRLHIFSELKYTPTQDEAFTVLKKSKWTHEEIAEYAREQSYFYYAQDFLDSKCVLPKLNSRQTFEYRRFERLRNLNVLCSKCGTALSTFISCAQQELYFPRRKGDAPLQIHVQLVDGPTLSLPIPVYLYRLCDGTQLRDFVQCEMDFSFGVRDIFYVCAALEIFDERDRRWKQLPETCWTDVEVVVACLLTKEQPERLFLGIAPKKKAVEIQKPDREE